MSETYCAKSCAECAEKEKLNCPGCKTGPGRAIYGECELARCCRTKGHDTCLTCVMKPNCSSFKSRASMPETLARKRRIEENHQKMLLEKAPFLGKWLWLLFWLVIPANIASLMTNDTAAEWFPSLVLPGHILTAITTLAYAGILWQLRGEDEYYRNAAKCAVATAILSVIATVMATNPNLSVLVVLISLANSVVSIAGEYNEYHAHATVTGLLDPVLSEKWEKLWVWYIGSFAATIGSAILGLIAGFLSFGLLSVLLVLVMLAASIATVVVGILKLVYLYQSAQLFRNYKP